MIIDGGEICICFASDNIFAWHDFCLSWLDITCTWCAMCGLWSLGLWVSVVSGSLGLWVSAVCFFYGMMHCIWTLFFFSFRILRSGGLSVMIFVVGGLVCLIDWGRSSGNNSGYFFLYWIGLDAFCILAVMSEGMQWL
jgi:hypothetical protein